MKKIVIIMLLLSFLIVPIVSAKESIVVNSDNWMDVYSGAIYAAIQAKDFKFLISDRHSSALLPWFKKDDHITVLESEKLPFIINYGDMLQRYGYSAETIKAGGKRLNTELAKTLNTRSFIIIDPSYGYDAVSVAPYAILTKSWVLFTDKTNIDEISDLLSSKMAQRIIIYGHVDQEVIDTLNRFRPEILNKGSRYDNNIEIIKKYHQIKPVTQLVLSSGEILEDSIFTSEDPVLFIGKDTVPDSTINFIKTSGIKYGVLVGNELTKQAHQLKTATGMHVFIKFAQGTTTGADFFTKVSGLDLFYLPSYTFKIELLGIRYNLATKTIDLALQNTQDLKTFLKTTIGVLAGEQRIKAVGDEGIEILEGDDRRGFRYAADLTEQIAENRGLTADIYTVYGESPNFMDQELAETAPLQVVEKEDFCEMAINKVTFDATIQRIIIEVRNLASVDCYVDANIADLIISDEPKTAALGETVLVAGRSSAELKIKQRMDLVDLEDNKIVFAKIYYGEDKSFLFKKTEGEFKLNLLGASIHKEMPILPLALGIILIFAIIIIYRLKKRK